jgi:uncharacterized NAD(P)/FAD-binding protein YdhS
LYNHVAIIGAGFSGTMLAVNLMRRPGPRVSLIERSAAPGLGLAYGAADASHLLNVRAANMSAFPDDPGHLVRWLESRGIDDAATSFAPRPLYGAYLQELLDEALRAEPKRLTLMSGSVQDLRMGPHGASLTLADCSRIDADAAVLCVGNLPPPAPRGLDPQALSPGRYWGDPWQPGVAEGLGADDTILVIGTGLTMVDMALLLEKEGFGGRILAVSRRGLIPRAHAPGGAPAKPEPLLPIASRLVRQVRTRGEEVGWRQAIDELRPITQELWRAASPSQKGRFLRHLRPWWDVHRHRIAPQVRARIDAMVERGQLQIHAGKLLTVEDRAGGAEVSWRPRGSSQPSSITVQRIVNCTGPEGDLPRSGEPLLGGLLERGSIRPGPCGIDWDSGVD